MKFITAFTIIASAASLLACGKSEDVPAPAAEPPVAEATQVEPAPVATAEPATQVVEPLPAEPPPLCRHPGSARTEGRSARSQQACCCPTR